MEINKKPSSQKMELKERVNQQIKEKKNKEQTKKNESLRKREN